MMEWYSGWNHACDSGQTGGPAAVFSIEGGQTVKLCTSQKCHMALLRLSPGDIEILRVYLDF